MPNFGAACQLKADNHRAFFPTPLMILNRLWFLKCGDEEVIVR